MTAIIDNAHCRIQLRSQHLVVSGSDPADETKENGERRIPLAGLERLILHERVQITSQALCALFRAGIPVCYVDRHGRPVGQSLPPPNTNSEFRLEQYRRALDPDFALAIACNLIGAKIYNQHRVLQRLQASRSRLASPQELNRFKAHQQKAQTAENLPQLMGSEGAATMMYFGLWKKFLPEAFPFERRSTRPPLDPVNACLSFGATLLYQETVGHLFTRGMDPGFGLLHRPSNGRWSLALDLIEPFRPALVEALTMRLFSHRMLTSKDFEPKNGGIYLNTRGRRTYLQQYERRMERVFHGEQAGHRTSLRQCLVRQVTGLKSAFSDPKNFSAFQLN